MKRILAHPLLEMKTNGKEENLKIGINKLTSASKKFNMNKGNFIQDAMKDLNITEDPIQTYYTFGENIGAGKYGIVKTGISVNNPDFKVAIKEIELAKLTGNYQTWVSEIVTLKKVDHPNIVKIYEIFKDEKNLYIVMEYVDGKELFEFVVEKTKINELNSANITKQLLKTIKYLNSMNICHRDIKPENILINPKSLQIKVIDFGLATIYSDFSQLTEKVGTPYYVSPEVLKGNYNKQCDMWSVGVIAYILLTGCPPFQGENLAEVYNEILYEKLKLYRSDWENLSAHSLEFVKQMLKKNPEIRMTPDQALAHPFILQRKTNSTIKTSVLKKLLKNKPSDFLKKEIFMILSTYFKNEVIERWNKCFHNLDKEGTGLIKVSELVKMMKDAKLNAASISKIEEECDGDADATISYSDFMTKVINFK